MFRISPSAADQILRAAQMESDSPALRVAAKRDAGGEVVYGMGFDERRESDLVIETEGVTVLIAEPSQPLLADAILDFVEFNPGEFQFIFQNPADSACQPAPGGSSGSRCGGCSGGCS